VPAGCVAHRAWRRLPTSGRYEREHDRLSAAFERAAWLDGTFDGSRAHTFADEEYARIQEQVWETGPPNSAVPWGNPCEGCEAWPSDCADSPRRVGRVLSVAQGRESAAIHCLTQRAACMRNGPRDIVRARARSCVRACRLCASVCACVRAQ
jgi:hypothetical protein